LAARELVARRVPPELVGARDYVGEALAELRRARAGGGAGGGGAE
jgi:hypothetical protein